MSQKQRKRKKRKSKKRDYAFDDDQHLASDTLPILEHDETEISDCVDCLTSSLERLSRISEQQVDEQVNGGCCSECAQYRDKSIEQGPCIHNCDVTQENNKTKNTEKSQLAKKKKRSKIKQVRIDSSVRD